MWKLLNLFICLVATIAIVTSEEQSNCFIKLSDDIKGFSPVILTSTNGDDYQLFKPTGDVTIFEEGFQLKLVCAGNNNVFENSNFNTMQLKCLKGNFVNLNNNIQPLKELVCKSIPISSMQITEVKCSHGNGYIYETGFIIQNKFYGPIFEICYTNVTENTFYAHSILNGAAISYSIPAKYRRPFSADGMKLSTAKTNMIYTIKNQIQRFKNYFGTDQTYVDEKKFLARGHLAADADFILAYEKLSTYYYVNVAPEFQVINAGNWLRVEELARAVAASYNDDIESYTSYMGILELPNKNRDLVEIYLDDGKLIKAPKYLFKVLIHRASDAGIVFVTVNNPYIQNGPSEEICTNVCEVSGFKHPNFANEKKGYTFCCKLNEFKTLVDTLPDKVQASNLLIFNWATPQNV